MGSIGVENINVHGLIGRGSVAEVFLVELINSKEVYAMKVLEKKVMEKYNLMRYVKTEKSILM